ncbi:MAG: hypothetical protein HXY40_12725 [Chloroflexi bacterium]|nr:hypothetical protein [Chloroflexota bacterium]
MTDNPPVRLLSLFGQAFPQLSPERVIKTPGRELWVAAAAATHDTVTIYATELGARTYFTVRSARRKSNPRGRPLPAWARYIAGVSLALDEMGMAISGQYIALAGNEPPGPRYDYALGMAYAALVYHLNEQLCTDSALLDLVERVRRDYIDKV